MRGITLSFPLGKAFRRGSSLPSHKILHHAPKIQNFLLRDATTHFDKWVFVEKLQFPATPPTQLLRDVNNLRY